MGLKYSINSAGRIVAERDIYSLGGFIPKGRLGGFIADKTQLSQEGECWLDSGDISTRPDVRIKDNAFIGGFFRGENPVHTDIVTEFSGNTLIPGSVSIRCFAADIKNNMFVKDSFIGVSMDVLCGPESTTTAFPFGQGTYNSDAAKGTLFENMVVTPIPVSICRSFADLRLGKDTYLYIPTGYSCRVLWAYYDTSDRLAYSGESTAFAAGLHKLSHQVYKVARMHIAKVNGTAMTPTDLLATGAKILGHISGSVLTDIRPESVSGDYVMVNSSFIAETDNFGLNAAQLRFLAGSMYDTTMYTKTDRQDYKPYGIFRDVERLEYTKYLGDSHRTAATRDTYISAYDCPLLRVDDATYNDALAAKGNLVLRRCIVPKAEFQDDIINGNTYEDVDFSFTNEDLGFTMAGYTRFLSSHKQGIYRLSGGPSSTGFVSRKGNLADTARLYQAEKYVPLDGGILEQGSYGGGTQIPYESAKTDSPIRIRTGKPLSTFGLIFPSLPTGYSVKALYYLDDDFVIRSTATDPTGLDTTYPYVVMLFRRDDDSAINVTDFIALNSTLRMIDHTKAPEITGSSYVGAGCTVRGDVKLIGDPYVNRLLDVNVWERGTASQSVGKSWKDSKISTTLGNRFRLMDTFPVEPGGLITCNSGYWVECGFFGSNGIFISSPGWGRTSNYVPAGAAYAGIVIKKATSASESGGLIEDSDIPLANVKYLRAFKKRRYIVNELDRTSPKDIVLGPDYWEQGGLSVAAVNAGKPYEELKIESPYRIRLKRLFGLGAEYRGSFSSAYSFGTTYYDAVTKLLYGSTSANTNNALLSLVGRVADSPTAVITPEDVAAARLVVEFVSRPRIIVPYGSSTLLISGPKIRMYDNAVLSRNLNHDADIVLQGDAVMGYDFNSGSCMCSNGHDDAIIKQP
jgi:hypothetical protein